MMYEVFALVPLLIIFGLALSISGFLIVIATSLGYLHYIADIVMIVYYWNRMEFYKHQEKPIRFGDVHRLLFEFSIALFITLLLLHITHSGTSPVLFPPLVWPFIVLGIFVFIEWVFRLTWRKYFRECWNFASILKNDTEGRYRSDWNRWFKNPNFHERIMGDAEKRKMRDLVRAFSPDNMTDIRWQNLHPDEVYKLGKTAAILLGDKKIVLGADSRKNSLKMLKKFKKGYEQNGGKVVYCGSNCTTPMIEFLGRFYNLTAVMITASHLDETWQGIKITPNGESKKEAEDNKERAFKDYVGSFPVENFEGLQLTVDYFEGSTARVFPTIAEKNGIAIVKELNAGMSGDFTFFPTMSPDPSIPENLVFITKVMKSNDAQLGVAFDGDGDRHVIILKQDNIVKAIDPVLLTAISAMYCKDEPGTFVLDPFVVPAEKAVKTMGHKAVLVKRGRPNMIRMIKKLNEQEEKVHKGVEGSYHSYDSENFDDGIRQFLEFCKYWKEGIDIEKAKEYIGCNYTLEMRVECKDDELFRKEVIQVLLALGQNKGMGDCVWIENSFIARKSSRENVVSFLFYGKNPREEMERVKKATSEVYKELAENLEKKFNALEQQREEFYW